jgi:hypothetical protein
LAQYLREAGLIKSVRGSTREGFGAILEAAHAVSTEGSNCHEKHPKTTTPADLCKSRRAMFTLASY